MDEYQLELYYKIQELWQITYREIIQQCLTRQIPNEMSFYSKLAEEGATGAVNDFLTAFYPGYKLAEHGGLEEVNESK